uniref:Serine/threonine protein kinase n=1 Tax=Macrostomum lignano TaxID=282301 RepID=A0A1I8F703_9PLAT
CRNAGRSSALSRNLTLVLRSHECRSDSACQQLFDARNSDGQAAMSTSVANSSAEISTSIYDVLSQSPQQQAQTQVCPVAT